jgi:hypothetical protein
MTERIVALAMLLASAIYLTQALRMPLGTAARPGAGFYPVGVGAFACVVALVLTAIVFRRAALAGAAAGAQAEPADRRSVLLAVVTLAAFCLVMPWAGYPLTALLFMATLLLQLGASWRTALVAAVLSAEGSYYLFAIVLGVTLPRGLWPH